MQLLPKLQVVIDTNVWISGLVFGGNPEKIIKLFIDGRLMVTTSEELLSELRRKVIQRFVLFQPQLALLEASIRQDAILVQLGGIEVKASRDADDNRVIETAVIGSASHIVSGDKDLLTLGAYQSIKILSPGDFLKLFE